MIRIDHCWGSKANPTAPPSPYCIRLPFAAAMMNVTSVICHKFLQQAATLWHPDWEKPPSNVVLLPRCDHTQMDPSYLWSGPVSEHTYKTAFHPLRLPVLSVLCLRRFYRLGWIYDCDAAVALKPPRCDRLAARLCLLAVLLGVWCVNRSPAGAWHRGGTRIKGALVHTGVELQTHPPSLSTRSHDMTDSIEVGLHRYIAYTHANTNTHSESGSH